MRGDRGHCIQRPGPSCGVAEPLPDRTGPSERFRRAINRCLLHDPKASGSLIDDGAYVSWSGWAGSPLDVATLTAIDVLLQPDDAALRRAKALNAMLRGDLPTGFALDETHVPHVTLLQRYVRSDHLGRVLAAVRSVLAREISGGLRLHAVGLVGGEFGTSSSTLIASIVIEPTPALRALHETIVEAVTPFSRPGGTAAAFVASAGEAEANATTIAYVEAFVPTHSGAAYSPHMTVGVGTEDAVRRLAASPFDDFELSPRALGVYQLGDLGTAQRLLGSWPLRSG